MIKKPNLLLLMFFTTSLLFTACVEEYDIEDKDFESRLVVNALFDADSPWAVEISKTVDIFDPGVENEKITFAKVEIFDQNNEFKYELYHQGDGVYGREDYSPSPKRRYSVKVSAPGFHAVTATGYVPEKSTLLINNFLIIPNDKNEDVEVDFEIEDKSQLESYYLWEIVSLDRDSEGSSSESSNQLSDTWIDQLTNNPLDLVNNDREFLGNGSFGDGTYQGSYSSLGGNKRIGNTKEIVNHGILSSSELSESSIKVNPHLIDPDVVVTQVDVLDEEDVAEDGDETTEFTFKYELRVMTISKELYDYYSSLEEYYQNGSHSHSGEAPFQLYTNVSNGAGIFAGFSESVIQF
jgi:hypothetical protein